MRAQEKPDTAEGTIVGTVAYMSPEQAEGKPVDARSDLFAFGSLFYEMVTGQRAFHGDSRLSTLSAILKEDPKLVSAVVADAPRDLEKIITRCLRKDSSRRFQHTDDLKIALAELKEESDSGTTVGSQTSARPGRQKVRFAWISGGALAAIVLAALGIWFWPARPAPRPAPNVTPLTSDPGVAWWPSFSPDGNHVAFLWKPSEEGFEKGRFGIYIKMLGGSEPLRR
jgi:serine/threonine protein kinase